MNGLSAQKEFVVVFFKGTRKDTSEKEPVTKWTQEKKTSCAVILTHTVPPFKAVYLYTYTCKCAQKAHSTAASSLQWLSPSNSIIILCVCVCLSDFLSLSYALSFNDVLGNKTKSSSILKTYIRLVNLGQKIRQNN